MDHDASASDGSVVVSTVRCKCCGQPVDAWKSFRCLECLGRFCEPCMCLVAWRGPGFADYTSGGMCRSCGRITCHHGVNADPAPPGFLDLASESLSSGSGRSIAPASDVRGSRRFRRRSFPPEV